MINKNTTQVGNPTIRKVSKAVAKSEIKSTKVKKLVRDLTDSMRHHSLVGMAAPQIGANLRVFVTEVRETSLRKGFSKKDASPLQVFINPKIVSFSKKKTAGWEGCGSVAKSGIFAQVVRPESVTVSALNQNGEPFTLKANGLLARVIQHEQDHLDGKVFLDRPHDTKSLMSQNEYVKKFKK